MLSYGNLLDIFSFGLSAIILCQYSEVKISILKAV